MDDVQFSDDEIKKQLSALGYHGISETKMKQFKQDLHKLVEHDNSSSGCSWYTDASSPITSDSDFGFVHSSRNRATSDQSSVNLSRFQPHLKVPERVSQSTLSQKSFESNLKPLPQVAQCSSADASHPQLETTDEAITQSENNPVQIDDSVDMVDTPATLPPDEGKPSNHSDANHTNVTPPPHSPEITQESLLTNPVEDTNTGFTNSFPEPTPLSGRVVRKRKVLRKQVDGTPRVFDESLVEDMRGGRGRYRLHDLSVDDSDPRLLHNITNESIQLPPRPHSARPMAKQNPQFDAFTKPNQPPSFIRPNTSDPHMRNIRKVDPVNKYHKYKEFWSTVKAPGEKSHKELRWEVKAQMMYKEEPAPKPQRVYVPNTYVVPTSKKRSALRWQVRHALERGLPIPNAYDIY
jgi:hydrolethalus syndrome protein 1